jgi:hypothetical protein
MYLITVNRIAYKRVSSIFGRVGNSLLEKSVGYPQDQAKIDLALSNSGLYKIINSCQSSTQKVGGNGLHPAF